VADYATVTAVTTCSEMIFRFLLQSAQADAADGIELGTIVHTNSRIPSPEALSCGSRGGQKQIAASASLQEPMRTASEKAPESLSAAPSRHQYTWFFLQP